MHPPPRSSGSGPGESDLLVATLSAPGPNDHMQRVMCEHADRCGGCPIIALPYGEQLAMKRGRVVQSVSRYPSLELVYTEPVHAAEPITEYRTRAKLIVASGGKLGLYAKGGGHQVVDIPRCQVVSPAIAAVASMLRARIQADEKAGGVLAPFDAATPTGEGVLRAVDLREVRSASGGAVSGSRSEDAPRRSASGGAVSGSRSESDAPQQDAPRRSASGGAVSGSRSESDAPQQDAPREDAQPDTARVLITLVIQRDRATPERRPLIDEAARSLAREDDRILGVAINLHEGDTPQILGTETIVIHGPATAADRIGLATHQATYGSFVQAHRGQAERVHQAVIDMLGVSRSTATRPHVLDLYGGSGAIALALAEAGADVHLIESFAPAVAHVDEAAKIASLPILAEAADVSSALRRLLEQRESQKAPTTTTTANTRFDGASVNPPRRGMSPLARELLTRLEVPSIAYVSCDPDTLARDLDHFTRLGYAISALRPLDMIPLTDEVETIALLRFRGLTAPKVMWDDAEVLIVEKGAHEPTTPQGEYASSLVARVRKIPGAEEAVPVHRIDVGTSGLVMFAKRADFAPAWQTVLSAESSRKIYVAGARGVTPSKGAITRDLREDGKMYPARTRYRRLAVASGHSVLRVVPEQGRTHQIRRHLAAIGHPVLGDDRYGHAPTNRFFEEKNALDRTFLHCVRLEFTHPKTEQRLIIEAPMPGDLRAVLERTSGPGTLRFLEHKNALGHSGMSTIPPPPDSRHETGSVLDIDSSSPTVHPEIISDDESDR